MPLCDLDSNLFFLYIGIAVSVLHYGATSLHTIESSPVFPIEPRPLHTIEYLRPQVDVVS